MKDPRDDYLPLEEIALIYFGHSKATMERWVGNKDKKNCPYKYPFTLVQFGTQKSPWFIRRLEFKRYADQLVKDAAKNAEVGV